MSYQASRRELFDILRKKKKPKEQKENLLQHLLSKLNINGTDQKNTQKIQRFVHKFANDVSKRWQRSRRYAKYFFKDWATWLNGKIKFGINKKLKKGRPMKAYTAVTVRTKQRRAKIIRNNVTANQLTYAACCQLRAEGRHTEAKLVTETALTSPTRAQKISKAWATVKSAPPPPSSATLYSADEALALMLDADLTRGKYNLIQQGAKKKKTSSQNIYPCYDVVREAKKRCYPDESCIAVDESGSRVSLQGLLDHTVKRICLIEESSSRIQESSSQNGKFVLLSKWGCDGSSGHSIYKQNKEDKTLQHASIFATCLVPLQLNFVVENPEIKKIIWENPRPNSTMFCRPLRIQNEKETTASIKKEIDRVNVETDNLVPTKLEVKKKELSVTHKLKMTMIDGKVCHAATDTASSQRCNVCNVNDIDTVVLRKEDANALEYGLSTLHAWIRFMEYFLHIAYRREFGLYKCPAHLRNVLNETKRDIQRDFREKLGLRVDEVQQGGGNSNDGNTARKFFHEAETTAAILELDVGIIRRCGTILQVLASGAEIDLLKFEASALSTARELVKEYGWYSMPPSVHKVLIHSVSVIKAAELPIGMYGEEAVVP